MTLTIDLPPDLEKTVRQQAAKNGQDVGAFVLRAVNEELNKEENGAKERFEKLAANWKAKTKFLSNVTTKIFHADYQKIIGMGKDAIPFILNDLADNGPNDWYWALTAITDVNPIQPEMAGNMVAMTEAWLQWGTQAGYLKDYPRTTNSSSRT
jgi:hypothetical protein